MGEDTKAGQGKTLDPRSSVCYDVDLGFCEPTRKETDRGKLDDRKQVTWEEHRKCNSGATGECAEGSGWGAFLAEYERGKSS